MFAIQFTQAEAIALAARLRGIDSGFDLTNILKRVEDAYSSPSVTHTVGTNHGLKPPHVVMKVDGKTVDPSSVDVTIDGPVGPVRVFPSVDQDRPLPRGVDGVRASLAAIVERMRKLKVLTETEVETVRDLLRHTGWHSFTCHECGKQTDDCVTVRRHKHGDCDASYTGPPCEELLAEVAAIFGLGENEAPPR